MKSIFLSKFFRTNVKSLEAAIEIKHTENLKEAEKDGTFYGRMNLPGQGDVFNNMLRFFHSSYGVVYHKAKQDIVGIGVDALSREVQLKVELDDTEKVLNVRRSEVAFIKEERDELVKDIYPWRYLVVPVCILLILLVPESFLNANVFQLFSDYFVTAGIIAFALSVAILLTAHIARKAYQAAVSMKERLILVVIAVVSYTILFYFIAELRNMYIDVQGEESTISIAALIVINWVFLIGIAVATTYLPTWKDFKRNAELSEVESKLLVVKRKFDETFTNITEIKKEIEGLKQDRESIPTYIEELKPYIKSLGTEAFGVYCRYNQKHRTDGDTTYGGFRGDDPFNADFYNPS